MKILIHIGDGEETRETLEWDRRRTLNTEYGAMERVTGLIGEDLEEAINKGGANAMTALVWILRRRKNYQLRYEQVVFEMADLSVEFVNDDGTPLKPEAAEPAAPKARKAAKKAAAK